MPIPFRIESAGWIHVVQGHRRCERLRLRRFERTRARQLQSPRSESGSQLRHSSPAHRFVQLRLLGGWQVNGIVTVQAGQPFTPYSSQFDPYRNESFNRLVVVGDPRSNVPSGLAYNPGAFAFPALGTFGASGRQIVRGDRFRTADISLFRNFSLTERVKLQIRFETTNSFNQVNYQGPVTNQSTNPGAFVATAIPRTLQLGAKISF